MKLLLFDHAGQFGGEAWRSWLSDEGWDVDCRNDLKLLTESALSEEYTSVICWWSDAFEAADREVVANCRKRAQAVYCVVPPDETQLHDKALEAGFEDLIADNISRKSLYAKLRRDKANLETRRQLERGQNLIAMGELTAGIAHEINTPIQYIGDNTRFVESAFEDVAAVLNHCYELIESQDSSEAERPDFGVLRHLLESADVEYLMEETPPAVKQTLEGIERVASIVRAMKEFSHPGGGEMKSTDLAHAIENTVMVARNEWKYVANVETNFDPALDNIVCRPGELNQVILNLIVNAAHAIGDATDNDRQNKGTIRISTQLDGGYAEIRISDTGTGIAKENIESIFAPFFTTKEVGKGTGQGLALARSVIVDNHHGSIDVESEVGKGTTFILRLPRQPQVSEAIAESVSS